MMESLNNELDLSVDDYFNAIQTIYGGFNDKISNKKRKRLLEGSYKTSFDSMC